jgi:hypothetical protein
VSDILAMPSAKNVKQLTYNDYYFRLMLLALSVFEWEGLPNGIDPKYIERYLFHEGSCMFFKDKKLGWMVAKCSRQGGLNYYDEPVYLRPNATNYIRARSYENHEECVFITNNDYCIPTSRTLRLYAARLAEIQRTADVNIIAQKTPLIVKGNDKQIKSLRQVIKNFLGDEPVSLVDKQLDISEMKVLNTAAPVVFDKLTIEKNKMWNECMTFLGINNANTDKRERLVDDEVQANNQQIELSAHVMLKARERAAEEISKMCGCTVTVKLRNANTGAVEPAATHKTLQPEGGEE